jgi:2-methylisocitrate lyase-like PEP mutase family enzyme
MTSSPTRNVDAQVRRAKTFAALHRADQPLLLANAWDVGSAVAIARAGAAAIATTSAGVAWSVGLPDAADLGAERVAAVAERIVAAVPVPVTVDIEAGYGDEPAAVAATVSAVLRAGAVGVNLEDRRWPAGTLFEPAEQAERIAAARAAAEALGIPMWINARTDVFLRGGAPVPQLVEQALDRAAAYAPAGADSLFVPGVVDPALIRTLAAGPLPVAVMAWSGAPAVAELAAAGAVRISLGSAVAQAAYQLAARSMVELATAGTYSAVADGIEYGAMNAALADDGARP